MNEMQQPAQEQQHGELLSCSMSVGSSGMSMSSQPHFQYTLVRNGDGAVYLTYGYVPSAKMFLSAKFVGKEALAAVQAFLDANQIPSWRHLRDEGEGASVSETLMLQFDDRSVGGSAFSICLIDCNAARQQGMGRRSSQYKSTAFTPRRCFCDR